MEQEPGQDPEHDGPDRPAAAPGSPGPAGAASPVTRLPGSPGPGSFRFSSAPAPL